MKKLTLIITLLSVVAITNAQTDEKNILNTDLIQINELIITPEIAEAALHPLYFLFDRNNDNLSNFGIKNKSQLENLHIDKPIPNYMLENENLIFTDNWIVPVISDGAPLLFQLGSVTDGKYYFADFIGNQNIVEPVYHYEHKDLVIGFLGIRYASGMDYHLIIRKENKDIFVQIYDEETNEFFKNEYSFSDFMNHIKELDLRKKEEWKEARKRYYDKIANKSELIITPEIKEMVINSIYPRFIDQDDKHLSNYGIKHRSQLENLQLGKPIPWYKVENENLTFMGIWYVPVLSSDDEPLHLAGIKLEDDGEYILISIGSAPMADMIHNYEYKDFIIGYLDSKLHRGSAYLLIRKENRDIFVRVYDYGTREVLKNEYNLSELINLLKK